MSSGEGDVMPTTELAGESSAEEVRTGVIPLLTRTSTVVDFEVIGGQAIFEGDIILDVVAPDLAPGVDTKAVAITGDRFRWPNGIVPFRIDPGLSNQARVTDAIQHWEQRTSIRFVPRGQNTDFVTFRSSDGCSSAVGKRQGEQFINLGSGCSSGSTIHEIGHLLGLWHEQSREDRDEFVSINWDNIQEGKEHNFNQHVSDGDDIGPYDYQSIMHYGAFAFAKDPSKPTIVAPQPIGQRNGLSAGDVAAIRFMYYFRRRGDSGALAGGVSELAAAVDGSGQLVTAVRTDGHTLRLVSWRVGNDGALVRTGDSGNQAGAASSIDIARARLYVTACATSAGDLKLISWEVTSAGAIARRGDSGGSAGQATLNRIVALTDDLLITASRTGAGSLKLITWRLGSDGAITRLADSGDAAGAVSEIAMARVTGGQVATAVRTAQGTLKVILWNISSAGQVARAGDSGSQAGEARMIRAVLDPRGHLVTAVRAADGSLKLISWRITNAGATITRLGDSGGQAGQIGDNALMSRTPGVISAVRTAEGSLKLIAWTVDPAGVITRVGDSYNLAGEATAIVVFPGAPSGEAPIVTAVRTAGGTLKLISWDD